MAYNENIPLATDSLSQSQAEIKDNFTEIKIVIDKDHETFGIPAQGEHKQATLTNHTPAAPGANKVRLYSNAGELCLKKGAAGAEVDFTSITDVAGTGHTILPSGLIINWGIVVLNIGATTNAQTLSLAFTTPYKVIHSVNNTNAGDARDVTCSSTLSTTQASFTRGWSTVLATVKYIAIGV